MATDGKPAGSFRGRQPIFTIAQMRVLRRMLAKTLGDVFRGMARAL